MNNACPECGAVYAVAEKDIGRRIACKKCNSALIVAEEGLIRDDDATGPPPPPRKEDTAERTRARDEEERPRKRDEEERGGRRRRNRDDDEGDAEVEEKPRKPRGPGLGAYVGKLKGVADVPTWLYGIGLFLTIYGYFGNGLDRTSTLYRQGKYESRKLDYEADRHSVTDKPDGKSPTPDENKRLEDNEKEWSKRTEPALKDDISYAAASEKKGAWYNVFFKMIGFFLLAFGSIGFLRPDESPLKRILGGVTILLVLLQIIGGGAGVELHMGGGGGARGG